MELPRNPNLELGQVEPGTVKAIAIGALLLPTAGAAAVSYVGFALGNRDEGWTSILGYIVGSLGAIFTVMGMLAMTGVAATPFNIPARRTSEEVVLPSQVPAAKI